MIIAASIHPNDVLVVVVRTSASAEIFLLSRTHQAVVWIGLHRMIGLRMLMSIELFSKSHGITQVRRRANVFDDGFHIPHVKIWNGFNGDFGLIDCPK